MLVIVCLVAALVGLFLWFVSRKPTAFRYERSIDIGRPAAVIFPHVAELRAWQAWSPWEGLDPALARTYSGPSQGVGAEYAWSGNAKAGKGKMMITTSSAPTRLVIAIDFTAPFEAHNVGTFDFEENEGRTRVVWAMTGNYPFMSKLVSVFIDLERLVGKDFEKGLAQLKTLAETSS
jgi:hypothetical protein